MAQRHYDPRGRQSREEDRRLARHRDDDRDRDEREMRRAYGRYSGSDQSEDRRRLEGERVSGARYRRGRGSYGGGMDSQGGYGEQGRYRGVGPKGYTRSDARIREDVCDDLADDAYLDASNIEVAAKDGEISLSGTVRSREDKRRAEDLAERISGVKDVQNGLRVRADGSMPDGI